MSQIWNQLISWAASTLSASSRLDSIIFLAVFSSPAQSWSPEAPFLSAASCISAILLSEKYREEDHVSAWSHMTAPAILSRDFSDGNTWTTLALRLISRLARSCTLLVRSRFQCDGGKSR